MATTASTRSSSMKRARAAVSGSDSGAGPGSYPGACAREKLRAGKLRFRSTSLAEFFRPARRPSGFSAGRIHSRPSRSRSASLPARRSPASAIRLSTSSAAASTLAGSSPWIPPNTSKRVFLIGNARSSMATPEPEVPMRRAVAGRRRCRRHERRVLQREFPRTRSIVHVPVRAVKPGRPPVGGRAGALPHRSRQTRLRPR